MLIGQYSSKLTDKNRVSIPAKIRNEIGNEMVIAKWYEECLVLVSKTNWQNLIQRLIGEAGLIVSPVRDIDRFIYGSAFEIELDGQGRFVLPENLIKYASIKQELVFVGLQDRVEIWSLEKWQEIESNAEQKASEAIENLAKKNDTRI